MSPTISLCMIVKNEGRRLAACLTSSREVAGEIVVVDTGSTDDTLAVAARFGAKISSFDFAVPDFSGARNQSLSRATGEWILVLDADEHLAAGAPPLLRALTSAGDAVGYVVQRRNLRADGTSVLTDHAVRLFPNDPRYRYRGRVHETIDAAILGNGGRIRTSHLTIDHLLPPDDGQLLSKSRFYLSILDEELALDPDDVDRLSFRRAELHKLGRLDEATRAAERIAALAPDDATSHCQLGLYRLVHQHDAEGAERAFRRALALDPGDAGAREGLRCATEAESSLAGSRRSPS
jgi:glycosyltransferase involved in cell wall biosynthesis